MVFQVKKDESSSRTKNRARVTLKTGFFDHIDEFCTALLTLLMMTAELMLSKRSVLVTTVALFFSFVTFILQHEIPILQARQTFNVFEVLGLLYFVMQ